MKVSPEDIMRWSDFITAVCYMAIPIFFAVMIKRGILFRNVTIRQIVVMGGFILFCGLHHAIAFVGHWYPMPWYEASNNCTMAMFSVMAVFELFPWSSRSGL